MFSSRKTAAPSSGYNLTKSLRFRSSASAYLNRTPSTAGNRQIFTWSAWVKRGTLGTTQTLFAAGVAGTAGDPLFVWQFSGDKLQADYYNGTSDFYVRTNASYRDPSAWYHLMLVVDSTQATSSNRYKYYVNGVQVTSMEVSNYPTQNLNFPVNNTQAQYLSRAGDGTQYFDGYMAEINFIDGQALTPSSFGSTNSLTGVWQPAKYTGTYGTNGFYLKFTDTTSTATLGTDYSGNSNTWTVNNISLTTGVTYDSMTDVPTLTSATIANYCVLNPLYKGTNASASNANLTYSCGTNSIIACTIGMSSGKWYWEIQNPTAKSIIGIINSSATLSTYIGANVNGWGYYGTNGQKYNNGGSAYGATFTTTDIIGVAFDAGAGTLTFYKNNTSQGTAFTSIPADTYFSAVSDDTTGGATGEINFGQRPFAYTPPTGFVALNTYNLPTSTIVKGNTVMDATLYTGNGSTQSITNTAGFKPDLVWVKSRSAATDHKLTDSVRGVQKALISDTTGAETTDTNGLTAFNSNGWSLGTDTNYNNNTATYVGWQWQAGQGSTSSNTSGSVTSTVSVNATAGFSVSTFTSPSSGTASFGHGLGVTPYFVIVKSRASGNWITQHTSTGTQYMTLNGTGAATTDSTVWNSAPTSSVVNIGTGFAGTVNYVAYCWTPIAGFSAFGSYTGNGSTDGPFVYLGFRPRYIMTKQTSGTSDWIIKDTSRDTYNVAGNTLLADAADAEYANNNVMDILSNGFKFRTTGAGVNGSGQTYIYLAFAENPFKNALAR